MKNLADDILLLFNVNIILLWLSNKYISKSENKLFIKSIFSYFEPLHFNTTNNNDSEILWTKGVSKDYNNNI